MEHIDIRISCLEFNYTFEWVDGAYVYKNIMCLEFNYTFKWVDDGAYGYKNKETGEWNGLMGELLSQVSLLLFLKLKRCYG